MTEPEFVELVEFVADRWGRDDVWSNASRFATDFLPVDAADVWDAMHALLADPEKAKWAPRPAQLISAARIVARRRHDPTRQALPQATGGQRAQTLSEWRQEHHDGAPMADIIRRRHAEIEGMPVTEIGARLPSEGSQIEDGMNPIVRCRSAHCDIHQADPTPTPDDLAVGVG